MPLLGSQGQRIHEHKPSICRATPSADQYADQQRHRTPRHENHQSPRGRDYGVGVRA